jgi:hypothetical protein
VNGFFENHNEPMLPIEFSIFDFALSSLENGMANCSDFSQIHSSSSQL